ncbi:hypothetical protein SAMN05421812_116127 [Asanoa hainanensis]|uniref:Uncharacterized protein n=1 Tax=Asanoa hainanensis TaxID=560556 RepID=A0A239PAR2_9ACTN|nr:hypothetical protein [Asanoa hainanensis]SNT64167.1 hypothetical protein SAMN05421812_116127 [Asanoa hainanensis]
MAEHSQSRAPTPTVIATLCTTGTCPTVYQTPDGTYLVQGRPVEPASVGIDVPADEALVEIPESLVDLLRAGGRRIE